MSVKPIDSFISNSVTLFEANPSQTTFSIAYRNEAIRDGKSKPKVAFKTHNAHLGAHYRFQTNKSKDVSRLLSALGPRGVTVTLGRVERHKKLRKLKTAGKKSKRSARTKDLVGMSTLMVNTDVKEYRPAVQAPKQDSKKKKSKSKSKNKKKR